MTLRRSTQAIMRYGAAGAAPTHIRNRWGGHVVDRFVMMESLYRYIHVYIHSASKRLRQLYFRDNFVKSMPVFTARHNARIASTVLTTAIPSVCPSIRLPYAGIVTKWLHIARCSLHCQITKCVWFCRNQKIYPGDDPFPLKSWLKVTYPSW